MRARLLAWMHDRSRSTDAAYLAGRFFVKSRLDAQGQLAPPLANDALAWYFTGNAYFYDRAKEGDSAVMGARAEKAFRRSIELDGNFARAHRNLALAILMQAPRGQPDPRAAEVQRELDEAGRLDPSLPLDAERGTVARQHEQFAEAERFFQKALLESPDRWELALELAATIVQYPRRPGPYAAPIAKLVAQFPNNGELACLHGLALAIDNKPAAAYAELQRARALAPLRNKS